MEIYGNKDTFNLESVLRQNIVNSDYYRNTCLQMSCWEDVVDEVYENVTHVEPWMSGNARGPSTAFCLLHRMFTLKLAPAEIRQTLDHKDSPYIRAVGFLYLRYACDPKSLWKWFERYVKDREEFQPSGEGTATVTIGDFVRDVLLEQYYFETIFPRIPKKYSDEIIENLKAWGLPVSAKGNGGAGGPDRRGIDEPNRRPASVKASLSVAFGQRAPNRAGAREEGRGRDPSLRERERERDREQRERVRSDRGEKDKDRDGNRGRDYSERSRSHRDYYGRSRSRSPAQHHHRHHSGGRDARDVFKDSADRQYDSADLKSRYGDASGRLYDEERRADFRTEERYRLGYRR